MRLSAVICLVLLSLAPAAGAQQIGGALDPGTVQSEILVIDFERLFGGSLFGQRVARELESAGEAVAAENRRIEAELIEEERELTEKRAQLPPDEFRELANAFDEKVTRLRDEQDAKAREIGDRSEDARRRFAAATQPVLTELMRESGAAVILERRAVFVAADSVDVTSIAISRLDAEIGDGSDLPAPDDQEDGAEAGPEALQNALPEPPQPGDALPPSP